MTEAAGNARSEYNGNGATTTFAIGFGYDSTADVKVIYTDATGTDATWSLGTQYTISSTNVVVSTSPTDYTPASGTKLTILSNASLAQATNLGDSAYDGEDIEGMGDSILIRLKQVKELADRAPKLKESTRTTTPTFPEPTAGQIIGWNSDADDLENRTIADSGETFPSQASSWLRRNGAGTAFAAFTDDEAVTQLKILQTDGTESPTADIDWGGFSIDNISDLDQVGLTRSAATAKSFAAGMKTIRTSGYTSSGDGGGALYKRVDAEPSHEGKFRSADRYLSNGTTDATNGGWWELVAFPFVTPEMFGAPSSGDASTEIQNMFSFLGEGGVVLFGQGKTYELQTGITHDKTVFVFARDAKFNVTANVKAFTFDAGTSEIKALSANYTAGNASVSVAALASAPVAGEPFKIFSNAVDGANRDEGSNTNQYRCGEWFVAAEGGSTTSIAMKEPLRFVKGVDPTSTAGEEATIDAYTTTMNARVARLAGKSLHWTGGTIVYEDGHEADPWASDAFTVIGYTKPLIEDLKITRGYAHGISLQGCFLPRVVRPDISNLEDNTSNAQYGYGIADSSYGTIVDAGRFYNCRHGYTSSVAAMPANDTNETRILRCGRTFGAVIRDCIGGGSGNADVAPFDTHHSSENATFINCIADGCGGYGFNIRGRNVKLINPIIRNCEYGMYLFTEYDSGDPDDDFWVAKKDADYFTSATVISPNIECVTRPFVGVAATLFLEGNAKVKQTSHVMFDFDMCATKVSGTWDMRTSTLLSARTITETTGKGIFHLTDTNATALAVTGSSLIFEQGSDVFVYCFTATDASNDLRAFYCDPDSDMFFRGRMNVRLSGDFSSLFSGSGDFSCSETSEPIIWAVDGAADNSITLNEGSHAVRFHADDDSAYYDATGLIDKRLKLSRRSVSIGTTHSGTGAMVESVFTPSMPQIDKMNSAGHHLRLRMHCSKTGSNGAATLRVRLSSAFVADISLLAADRSIDIEFDAFMQGAGDQRCIVKSVVTDGAGGTAVIRTWQTDETVTLSSATFGPDFGVNAASGDTIVFETYTLEATVAGYGI